MTGRRDTPEKPPPTRRLRDPRELRAVAHPLRMAIIELLTVHGPLTATELADRLDESPANCSWHLRKLAEHSFVEEAEGGQGRRRPWQVSRVGMSWNEGDDEDDDEDDTAGATAGATDGATGAESRRAGRALSQMLLERWVDRYLASAEALEEPGQREWSAAASMGQSGTWLTPAELAEANAAIRAVMMRHHDRLTDPARRPEGARLCELVAWGAPVEMGRAGGSARRAPR